MQIPNPSSEHLWLQQLVGEWEFEHECDMGPDQPISKSSGKQSTRALGALWTLGEMETPGPDGQPMRSIMTIGYDPSQSRFVGNFIASCMTFQWIYSGQLDQDRRVLTLDATGPSFSGDGSMANYQDIIEVIDSDNYIFSSRYQNVDGSWVPFMKGKYTRRK